MKSSVRIDVLVVASGVALLAPMVSRAAEPPVFPASVHLAKSAQTGTTTYQFTTIDAPGSSDTEAFGINTPGVVTGFYLIQGFAHGFIWRNGSITTADVPGAVHTLLGDVSEPGLVIGNAGHFFQQHAVMYSIHTGTFTTLPDVGTMPMNFGNGINPQGTAVGSAAMGDLGLSFDNIAWIWDGRAYSFFNAPGATGFGTSADGINASGQVSGYFQDAGGVFHGFVKDGSSFTQIDVPGATATFGYAINSRTDVVGWYTDQQNDTHGFVLSRGKFTTIDVPGSLGTMVTGVNNKGELAGLWFAATATHSFIASPR
jgi:hypothetical protein